MAPFGLGGMLLGPDTVPSSGGGFTPLSLSPTLWLNGRAGIVQSSGNVTGWNDQSSNGNNYTASATYPTIGTLNGLTAVSFDYTSTNAIENSGSNPLVSSTAFTIFAVWQLAVGANNYNTSEYYVSPCVLSWGSDLPNGIGSGIDPSDNTRASAYTGVFTGGIPQIAAYSSSGTVTSAHQSYHAFDGTLIYASIDGGSSATTTTGGPLFSDAIGGRVGDNSESSSSSWYGVIGEIIVYNTFLTSTQITQVQNYLNTEWGL
jgi:hypothetical protein